MHMQSEQQQRIMGYFIEEAKDHLNTIEQGLLSLQSTIEDPEMVNEVFRAAHSVKGGAAMLGLSSIQQTSHRLEDYFKVLRECPIRVDQRLETLFLRVFDTLQELLDQLQGPFGLTDDKADEIMANVEPIFSDLHEHLSQLVTQAGGTPPEDVDLTVGNAAIAPSQTSASDVTLRQSFQTHVPAYLREMLQLFKQAEDTASRHQLQDLCQTLSALGLQFNLSEWCQLLAKAQQAIACSDNSFKVLAPVLIRDIKRAQEQVLAGNSADITCSEALDQLIPPESSFAAPDLDLSPEAALNELFAPVEDAIAIDEPLVLDAEPSLDAEDLDLPSEDVSFLSAIESDEDWFDEPVMPGEETVEEPPQFEGDGLEDLLSVGSASDGISWESDRTELIDVFEEETPDSDPVADALGVSAEPIGPEVGAAELNSLADLFEGEGTDLGLPWDEDSLGEDPDELLDALDLEMSDDFSDLLFDQSLSASPPVESSSDDISGFLNLNASPSEEPSSSLPPESIEVDAAFASDDPTPLPEASAAEPIPEQGLDDLFDALLEDASTPTEEQTPVFPVVESSNEATFDALFGGDSSPDMEPGGDAFATTAGHDAANLFDDFALEFPGGDGAASPDFNPFDEPDRSPAADASGTEALVESLFGDLPFPDEMGDITADLWETSDPSLGEEADANLSGVADSLSEESQRDEVRTAENAWVAEPPTEDSTSHQDEDQRQTDAEDTITALTDLMEPEDQMLTFSDLSKADPSDILSESTLEYAGDRQADDEDRAVIDLDADRDQREPLTADQSAIAFDAEATEAIAADFEFSPLPDLNLDHGSEAASESALESLPDPHFDLDTDQDLTLEEHSADEDAALLEAPDSDLDLESAAIDLDAEGDYSADQAEADVVEELELDLAEGDAIAEGKTEEDVLDTDFSDLEALLADEENLASAAITSQDADVLPQDDFADLEALIGAESPELESKSAAVSASAVPSAAPESDEFDDLEKLLEDAEQTLGGTPTSKARRAGAAPAPRRQTRTRPARAQADQNMRVSVKNLDNLNNLIGELVVNRNSLEQTQERLRQFLDNLLYQVQQLSDVGQRMRDLYERSLLESSLLSSRRTYAFGGSGNSGSLPSEASHATGANFDALEMDRFTGFHTLSQEMIELIVRVRESASDIDFVVEESDQVTRTFRQVTTQLQEGLTRARMVPFAQTADRLPRAVRDISLRCGKQAELVVEGRDTLIDKMILEQLYDPMTHLVNNAITHGIETPEQRQAAGKPAAGKIVVRSFHQGNQTVISITDDGAGIDPERVKQKAIEKGLITPQEAQEMTRHDVYDLLFHSGFSTRDKADDFAGRGVGMDVVRTNLNEIRGTITTDSAIGSGTTFTIRLPLTLSISKALCCISNRARIAFPMDGVEDMLDVPKERIQTDEEGRPCIMWRDILLPFQPLQDLLTYNRILGRGSVYGGQEEDIVSIVVLRSAGNFLALQVDQVLGEQEIVIKQLEGPVPKPVGIAGATVLGDGRIMPIADVLELIDLSLGRIRRDGGSALWSKDAVHSQEESEHHEPTVLIVDDSITVRELLSMTFNKVGYRVEQARDGQEAWEKLRSGLPCDLVFCDIEMPRMDGLELLSRLQKDPTLSTLPIAMLTSRGADRHRQMAISLGAKGYFTKPYLEEVLLDAAQRMLKGEVLVTTSS